MRRQSAPGWTGAAIPRELLMGMSSGNAMPCHMTVDYDDSDWKDRLEDARQCSGQAIYLTHTCTIPRPGPSAALRLPADRETVFGNPLEFLEHHEGAPVPERRARPRRKAQT
jgi:hypothetical protein